MDNRRPDDKIKSITFTKFYGIIMPVVYLGFGIWLILSEGSIRWLNRSTRLVCGILFISYGILRAYRTYKLIRDERS